MNEGEAGAPMHGNQCIRSANAGPFTAFRVTNSQPFYFGIVGDIWKRKTS